MPSPDEIQEARSALARNPVKLKLLQGGKVPGGTFFNTTDPTVYCAMTNTGYDFIWNSYSSFDQFAKS